MKLDKVEIKNFRSIQDIAVDFQPTCRVLVGINESGKSNILRALSLLSDKVNPVKKDDQRDALPDEDNIEEAYVRFIFKFEKKESDQIFEHAVNKVAASEKNPVMVLFGGKRQTLKEFCFLRDETLYEADILEETKRFTYWALGVKYGLLPGWKKPTPACPADFVVELSGKKYQLSQYKLLKASDFQDVPPEYLEDANIKDLSRLTGEIIIELAKNNVPKTLMWEYDEGNLLPSSVKIPDFSANPESCIPLKNMFLLAGVDDIKSGLDSARQGTDNQFQNYLDRVAKKTTNHFRKVWKEYRNIEFSLKLNADQIIPGIKEKNTYDFARRSDGFKRFVTFLLMISVNVKTDNLRDTLLLIDEPDISLHPSGVRYLRDELIEISKTNYVFYSTHSIFMIDTTDLARHYIVKKEKEITTIEPAKNSNIADEEVLYNALGHSVFSVLKEKNIIFEGWNDKHLFLMALKSANASLKNKFKNVGFCHAKGVGTIKAITPMIELAKRGCLIISDCDTAALDQQRIYKKDKGFGEWKTYKNIDSTVKVITGEDFVKNDFISKRVKEVLSGTAMPVFDQTVLDDRNKLAKIMKWLIDNGMNIEQAKDTVAKIKNSVFEKLKSQDIDSEYNKILEGITL